MRSNFAYDTEALWQQDRDHIIHPWIDLGTAKTREPLIVAEAEGVHIYDSRGHRMIDAIGGMWCVNIGYGRDEMAQAIADQVRRMPYFSPFGLISTPASIDFGSKLAQYTPGDLKHVFFTTGGSTAVDLALRFIQFYNNFHGRPKKKHIITREYAYHGSTYLSASVSGKPGDRGNLDFVTDTVHHLPAPNTYRRPEGMSEAEFCDAKVADLENKIKELGPENVACFIAEPLMASGGVIVPPKGYQRRTWEVCRKYDVMYISDEVVTGFGRLGEIFASEPVFDIVPDIITSAKGLTSGYVPLGAFFISDKLYEFTHRPGGRRQVFHQWLHLFRPSGRLRRRPQEPRDHRARTHPRSCPGDRALLRQETADAAGPARGGRCSRQPYDGLRGMRAGQEDARRRCRPIGTWPTASSAIPCRAACWYGRSAITPFCRHRLPSPRRRSTRPSRYCAPASRR